MLRFLDDRHCTSPFVAQVQTGLNTNRQALNPSLRHHEAEGGQDSKEKQRGNGQRQRASASKSKDPKALNESLHRQYFLVNPQSVVFEQLVSRAPLASKLDHT